jgi:hypothetical protein
MNVDISLRFSAFILIYIGFFIKNPYTNYFSDFSGFVFRAIGIFTSDVLLHILMPKENLTPINHTKSFNHYKTKLIKIDYILKRIFLLGSIFHLVFTLVSIFRNNNSDLNELFVTMFNILNAICLAFLAIIICYFLRNRFKFPVERPMLTKLSFCLILMGLLVSIIVALILILTIYQIILADAIHLSTYLLFGFMCTAAGFIGAIMVI